ncbi:MAG: UDP-3-O-acyl-N-acetylglucosamine deacetylase, partial [Candidatus Aminicenantes bacterium]|nr:UDP-3-O-acyl-N-acetylglucosamine deacetylase [Candidatus Aminicenantes bacterium]
VPPKTTLAKALTFSGPGIHSGRTVHLSLKPSRAGEVVFRRLDLGAPEVRLDPRTVATANASNLVSGSTRVETVEHLLAALSGCGVDSALVELDGGEVPILDGSAAPFARAIADAGLVVLAEPRRTLVVVKPFALEEGAATLEASPYPAFSIAYTISFDHPAIGTQTIDMEVVPDVFLRDIAPARTFGFLRDVAELQSRGLARGGSFENAIVLDETSVLNGPLRFPDEFVRHKVLDLVGDLFLLGVPVRGRFSARRAGHRLHLRAVKFLLDHPDLWTWE